MDMEKLLSFHSLDEEQSVEWGDVAEDSADQEQTDGLQVVPAASPEKLTEVAIDFAVAADPELASALVTLRKGHANLHQLKKARGYFRGTFDKVTAMDHRQARPGGRPRFLDHRAATSNFAPPPSSSTSADRVIPEEQP